MTQASGVLIVGAGPVGLTLALELARRGIVPRIVEKLAAPLPFCRAIGVTPRTLEVFEDIGVAREVIDAGVWLTGARIIVGDGPARDISIDFSDLPYSQLGVPQYATEAVLAARLATYGVMIERGTALADLLRDENGVSVGLETTNGREQCRFRYVVGCDGAHSAVRRALDIPFEGEAMPMEFMLGDVHVDWDLPRGMALRAVRPHEDAAPDIFVAVPLPEVGRYRVSAVAPAWLGKEPAENGSGHGIQSDRPGATLADLQQVANEIVPGTPVLSDMRWSSIFRISMRLAACYRAGNAFIAGDACHIHPPTGGQGMNTGIQDAYNLGWKLALVMKGEARATLLDSYEAERRPVAADVVARTTEQSINLGREKSTPHRLQDTQLLVSYRGGPLARGAAEAELAAGDRVPDVQGLRRFGLGYPLRLFDLLKGTQFVLLAWQADAADHARIAECATALARLWPEHSPAFASRTAGGASCANALVRVIAIRPGPAKVSRSDADSSPEPVPASFDNALDLPGIETVHDAQGNFASTFGEVAGGVWLVRPDNYLGLVLDGWTQADIVSYLRDVIGIA